MLVSLTTATGPNAWMRQPRTQALHCFYRDHRRLINAKRARVLGQHAKKPSAQGC